MESPKTAAFCNLGCKVNSYETEAMKKELLEAGYKELPFSEKADVYVINTCSVTAIADKKTRQMIRRARNLNVDAIVIACGCFVEKPYEEVLSLCDILLGNNEKTSILQAISDFKLQKTPQNFSVDIFSKDTEFEEMISGSTGHTRAFIKIQDGCDRYCAYCTIPFLRGKSRSRKIENIVKEAESLSYLGHKEIVLCGINLSDFHDGDKGLGELLPLLSSIEKIERIRLGSLEPDVFTPEFVEILAENKKICPHFHFSLQSACDKVLKNMGRKYTVDAVFLAAENLRRVYKNPAICADVICGFPGESNEDFEITLKNIRDLKLYELHVFPYSGRPGTRAEKMQGKLSRAVKEERAKRMLDLSKELSREYIKLFEGTLVDVLFEEKKSHEDGDIWLGFTKNYIKYASRDLDIEKGQIKRVRFDDNIKVG